jgi:four helix bundle protein
MTGATETGSHQRSYKDLVVWQKAMDLVDVVYDLSSQFPRFEDFGLRSQITRAAVSIPANIAEGQGRGTAKDFANFLTIARSSVLELETLLLVALRRGYIDDGIAEKAASLADEVKRMLGKLRQNILKRQV